MPIITVHAQKGGAGKTTTAVGLAVAAASRGRAVVIVDADGQGGALDWQAMDGEALPRVLHASELDGLDTTELLAIIDTPPASALTRSTRQALAAADVVIVPARPVPGDLVRVPPTVEAIAANGDAPAVVLLTQVRGQTREAFDATEALTGAGLTVLAPSVPLRAAIAAAYGGPVPAVMLDAYSAVLDAVEELIR